MLRAKGQIAPRLNSAANLRLDSPDSMTNSRQMIAIPPPGNKVGGPTKYKPRLTNCRKGGRDPNRQILVCYVNRHVTVGQAMREPYNAVRGGGGGVPDRTQVECAGNETHWRFVPMLEKDGWKK